ncbi:hypothetical protein ACR6HW_04950 [Fusibacter sp. JL298sf-3]
MITATVLKRYIDVETKEEHVPGEVVEVTASRFKAINGTAHGIFLEDEGATGEQVRDESEGSTKNRRGRKKSD